VASANLSLSDLFRQQKGETSAAESDELSALIRSQGTRQDLSNLTVAPEEEIASIVDSNEKNFSDLIQFFQTRVKSLSRIYVSMTLEDASGARYGIRRILAAVLP